MESTLPRCEQTSKRQPGQWKCSTSDDTQGTAPLAVLGPLPKILFGLAHERSQLWHEGAVSLIDRLVRIPALESRMSRPVLLPSCRGHLTRSK
jgi:hypothetical protein